jgi:hypothetical protein
MALPHFSREQMTWVVSHEVSTESTAVPSEGNCQFRQNLLCRPYMPAAELAAARTFVSESLAGRGSAIALNRFVHSSLAGASADEPSESRRRSGHIDSERGEDSVFVEQVYIVYWNSYAESKANFVKQATGFFGYRTNSRS